MKKLLIILSIFLSLAANSQMIIDSYRFGVTACTPDTSYSATVAHFNTRGAGGVSVTGWTDLSPLGDPHLGVRSATDNGFTLSTNTTSAWNGLPATSGTSGTTTSDGGGFYHSAGSGGSESDDLNDTYFFNYNNSYSGATTDANFKISGLTEDSIYCVEFVPSRVTNSQTMKVIPHDKDGQQPTITTFWNGATLNAQNNTSKFVRFFVKADATGAAYFYIGGSTDNSTTSGVNIGYVNSLTVRKATITTCP